MQFHVFFLIIKSKIANTILKCELPLLPALRPSFFSLCFHSYADRKKKMMLS